MVHIVSTFFFCAHIWNILGTFGSTTLAITAGPATFQMITVRTIIAFHHVIFLSRPWPSTIQIYQITMKIFLKSWKPFYRLNLLRNGCLEIKLTSVTNTISQIAVTLSQCPSTIQIMVTFYVKIKKRIQTVIRDIYYMNSSLQTQKNRNYHSSIEPSKHFFEGSTPIYYLFQVNIRLVAQRLDISPSYNDHHRCKPQPSCGRIPFLNNHPWVNVG